MNIKQPAGFLRSKFWLLYLFLFAAGLLLIIIYAKPERKVPQIEKNVLLEYTSTDNEDVLPSSSLFGIKENVVKLYDDTENGLLLCGSAVHGNSLKQFDYRRTSLPQKEREDLIRSIVQTGVGSLPTEITENDTRLGNQKRVAFRDSGSTTSVTHFSGPVPSALSSALNLVLAACEKAKGNYEAKSVVVRNKSVDTLPEGVSEGSWNDANLPLTMILASEQTTWNDQQAALLRANFKNDTEFYARSGGTLYHLSLLQLLPGESTPATYDPTDDEQEPNEDVYKDEEIPTVELEASVPRGVVASAQSWLIDEVYAASFFHWDDETDQIERIAAERKKRGLKVQTRSHCLTELARHHSQAMAAEERIFHNSNVAADITNVCNSQWSLAAENVGMDSSSQRVFDAFMDSDGHRKNILNSSMNYVAVGVAANNDGVKYFTHLFAKCSSCSATWYTAPSRPTRQTLEPSNELNNNDPIVPGQTIVYRIHLYSKSTVKRAALVQMHLPPNSTPHYMSGLGGDLTKRDRYSSTSGTQWRGYDNDCFDGYEDSYDGNTSNGCPHAWWSVYMEPNGSGYVEFWVKANKKGATAGNKSTSDPISTRTMSSTIASGKCVAGRARVRHYYKDQWWSDFTNHTSNCVR